jgi:hypothetical protein
MRRGSSRIFINAFLYLPQHVSASHCHHQRVVVSSEATQAVCIVNIYGLRPVIHTTQTAWVTSEETTIAWWWQWLAETCWGKYRNALIKILLLPRRICWFYNCLNMFRLKNCQAHCNWFTVTTWRGCQADSITLNSSPLSLRTCTTSVLLIATETK